MKLYIIIITILTGMVLSAQAQVIDNLPRSMQCINKMPFPPATTGSTEKGTATLWRTSATSAYRFENSTLEIIDSSSYSYSNGRGSTFNYASLYLNDNTIHTDVKYNTAVKFRNTSNGLKRFAKYINLYDGNNNTRDAVVQVFNGGVYNNDNRTVVIRDVSDRVTHYVSFSWNDTTSSWDSSFISIFGYDSQNHLVSENAYTLSGGVQTPEYVINLTYNSNNNLSEFEYSYWDGTAWTNRGRVSLTYQANLLSTARGQLFIDSMWQNNFMDSIGYGANDVLNYYESRDWDTTSVKWVNTELEIRMIDSTGRPALATYSNWDTGSNNWERYGESELFYDGNNNVKLISSYEYTSGVRNTFPTYIRNYYYEFYFNVGVAVTEPAKPVIVYPNPATSNINIILEDAKDISITLTDIAGHTVRMKHVADNAHIVTLNVAGLPAGNYVLNVSSKGTSQGRQIIAIQ